MWSIFRSKAGNESQKAVQGRILEKLPIAPENWSDLKKSVSGLDEAAQAAQRRPENLTLKNTDIKIMNKSANHDNSLRILGESGLRPLTYQEALVLLSDDPKLKGELRTKWFWLEGRGIKLHGSCTIQPNGSLKEGDSSDLEKNIYVCSGEGPLTLEVYSDHHAAAIGRRFEINPSKSIACVAELVVGVRVL